MKQTIRDIQAKKRVEKISMLTAYDFPTASLVQKAGIDIVLVGDSLGNVVHGFEDTLSVSMDLMVAHCQAVTRAPGEALIVADMPFGSYQPDQATATKNAVRFLSEGRAHAVKLEGGEKFAELVEHLVSCGIPVMGHVGLVPQSVNQLSGYRMQGKTDHEKERILRDALALEKAGAFSIVLECVQADLAETITNELKIPTIGIGSGTACDGQVLVFHDLMGFSVGHVPKFVTPEANLNSVILEATKAFIAKIKDRKNDCD